MLGFECAEVGTGLMSSHCWGSMSLYKAPNQRDLHAHIRERHGIFNMSLRGAESERQTS